MAISVYLSDLRGALRRLVKRPVFTLVAVLTLGLGIGANTALFSIVNSTVLRPLPYTSPTQLAVVFGTAERGAQQLPHPPANFLDFRERSTRFEDMGAAEAWSPTLGGEQRPEKVTGLRVTPNLFSVLGVQPAVGRPFRESDGVEGAETVVLLSHGMAQRLGGTSAVIGKQLRLDGRDHTVVGVMPGNFVFPTFWVPNAEIWTPLQWSAEARASRRLSTLRVFGRLRPGADFSTANEEIRSIAASLAAADPIANQGLSARVVPLTDVSGGVVRSTVLVLFAAVGLLLLVACANLAGLLIARAAERRQELSVRLALGASAMRMGWTVAVESILLVGGGCAAGLGIAAWALQLVTELIPASALASIYGAGMVKLDWPAFAFTLALGGMAAMVFGILPALLSTRGALSKGMRTRGGTDDRRTGWLRSGLVVGQCAVAFSLVVCSGLLAISFRNLATADAGFDAQHVLSFVAPVTGTAQGEPGRKAPFYRELAERLRALPGVEAASAVNHVPLLGDEWGTSFLVEGMPAPEPGAVPNAVFRVMMPGYLNAVGARLLEGRDFNDADRADSMPVVIVNQTLAHARWPGESAIGKRIRSGSLDSDEPWSLVVGVVADLQQRTWSTTVGEELIFPMMQSASFRESSRPPFAMTMVLRTKGDPTALIPSVRRTVWELAPDVPVARLLPLRDGVEEAFWRPRLVASMGLALAILSALLSGLGIYGVFSQFVNRQQRSIGIRMALGATPRGVLGTMLLRGVFVALAGGVLGLPIALAGGRFAESLLIGVKATDAAVLGAGIVALGVLGVAATLLPARRAAGVDPAQALRGD